MNGNAWSTWSRTLLGKLRRRERAPEGGHAPIASPAPPALTCRSMAEGMRVLSQRGSISTVIDVGASNGSWTRLVRPFFPEARFLLIEAQGGPHEEGLRTLAAEDPAVQYLVAAAGPREGTIHFDASDPYGGVASEAPTGQHDIVVPVTTIDAEIARRGLRPPFLIKLDTHGFEVPILEGAAGALASTGALVIEAYGFQIRPEALRFHELCAYLEARGFRCVDIADVMYRPSDGALWQMDLFFVPASSPVFSRNTYQ